ncbi:hypothetical protein [Phormidium tenue]|uniref:O-antigen polymerase n=1 Tax=Phormidium tenue NIES-30 TaxID=549789 RepID=A0A1U7J669_9CYAN|nr:hypothetical protein [Phormidium tenue]MBD2231984.1 hypothetical protein [Phormidium tenue FACHB-1052]OKH48418.1 hypothetical protein NIES30_10370 [Phormidium tenue NIES-30]
MTNYHSFNSYITKNQIRGFISNPSLVLVAFASAFFPRIIEAMGAPAPINFLHFCITPIVCLLVYLRCGKTSFKQKSIVRSILIGLYVYFAVSTASAIVNNAGAVNIFLNFMIQSEPFLVLSAIISIPFNEQYLGKFRRWVMGFGLLHIVLSLGQYLALKAGILTYSRLTLNDNVQGVFYLSNGGHVVGGTVVFIYAIYFYITAKKAGFGLRAAVLAAGFLEILVADAKQVLLVAAVAWIVLIISRTNDIKKTLKYTLLAAVVIYGFYWCIYNIDVAYLSSFRTWIRPEIYGPNGDATLQKLLPLRSIPEYYTSILNWFLGLGPGHTVGRIGGWMIRDYDSLLDPLGATRHPVVQSIWDYWLSGYLDSSFFSPFWTWAGIWGDGGFIGLGVYVSLWVLLWNRVCVDDLSRFLLLNVIVNGFIMTGMEEPGFMLTIAVLLGLRWHELNPVSSQIRQSFFNGKNRYLA